MQCSKEHRYIEEDSVREIGIEIDNDSNGQDPREEGRQTEIHT